MGKELEGLLRILTKAIGEALDGEGVQQAAQNMRDAGHNPRLIFDILLDDYHPEDDEFRSGILEGAPRIETVKN